MPERIGFMPEEAKMEGKEGREKKETINREQRQKTAFKWLKTLTGDKFPGRKNLRSLPRSKELGSAFVPVLLLTSLIGCEKSPFTDDGKPTADLVSCLPNEKEFFDQLQKWLEENPEALDKEIGYYIDPEKDQGATAKQLGDHLKTSVDIQCATWSNTDSEGKYLKEYLLAFGEEPTGKDRILVNISDYHFQQAIDSFDKTSKLGLDFSQLVSVENEGSSEIYHDYLNNTAVFTDYLVRALGDTFFHGHTAEAKEMMKTRPDATDDDIASVDPMTAWGMASEAAFYMAGDQLIKDEEGK